MNITNDCVMIGSCICDLKTVSYSSTLTDKNHRLLHNRLINAEKHLLCSQFIIT